MAPLFVDLHVLQTVPPSNLNRDDTGSPKSAIYGGVNRARVSSQAWKRATRREFDGVLDRADVGVRTKRVLELIVARMRDLVPELDDAERERRATDVLTALGLKVEAPRAKKGAKDEGDVKAQSPRTEYLVFFSNRQLDQLAELATRPAGKVTKKEAQEAADTEHGIEVALFGRMVANAADLRVDAAVQVAHAISTHAVEPQFDYFTAVDDKSPEDESGAGMIGTVEFNSATMYRFATVNVQGLRDNLGNDEATVRAAQAFVQAFVCSMPTGKQNTFGNRTLPDAVVVTVRSDQPVSYAGAFEEAVTADGRGFVRGSCEALATYAGELRAAYGHKPALTLVTRAGERTAALARLGDEVSFDEVPSRLEGPLRDALQDQA